MTGCSMKNNNGRPRENDPLYRRLFDLSRQLVVSLDLDEILQAAVDGVASLAGLDTAALYLLDNKTLRLCNTVPPLPPDLPESLRLANLDDHPFICKAIITSAPVMVPDVTTVTLTEQEQQVVGIRNLRTLLFLPLIAETEVMGALIVGSVGAPIVISEIATDLAYTLANFAALAVKNARLFEAGKKYAAELEHTLSERKRAEAEQEKLREQLLQAQKMEAIGQLAGGIAHDFNNLLSGIIGNAELLLLSTNDEELRALAREIIRIGERSAALNAQLLAFSRKGTIQIVPVDLHTIISDVVSILRHTISRSIEIRTFTEATSGTVEGDPAQLQSALLNLAVNARDAMPEGGILDIRTQCVDLDSSDSGMSSFEIKPGRYIEITVADTGCGIDAGNLGHIYEPFFTTKEKGEGTGMGLSAVYGTVKTHGGAISVTSAPGQGTAFRLYFPVSTRDSGLADVREEADGDTDVRVVPCFRKRVLVIDDEEMVARVAAAHLRRAGFEVEVFLDSVDALAYFKENYKSICMVILDIIMPGMDGPAIFRELISADPQVRVILSSGFSVNGIAQKLLGEGALAFIQKPFRSNDLVGIVRKILETRHEERTS